MSEEIELNELKKSNSPQDNTDSGPAHPELLDNISDRDQAVTLWAYGSTVLLMAFAVPLILFPRFLLFTSETANERRNSLTSLESFLALHGGILLLAFSMGLLFNIPSDSELQPQPQNTSGHPLLVPLTSACTLIAFLSYNTISVSSLAFLVFFGSAIIGIWGLWTIAFGGTSYTSRKTGADKHTSGFIFGNRSAASVQKKRWKKEQLAKKGL